MGNASLGGLPIVNISYSTSGPVVNTAQSLLIDRGQPITSTNSTTSTSTSTTVAFNAVPRSTSMMTTYTGTTSKTVNTWWMAQYLSGHNAAASSFHCAFYLLLTSIILEKLIR
jgi:hypothetical protein